MASVEAEAVCGGGAEAVCGGGAEAVCSGGAEGVGSKRSREEAALLCVICLEEKDEDGRLPVLACAEGHAMHASCLSAYVSTKAVELQGVSYIAAKADTASVSGDAAALDALAGACCCPLRGYGCSAEAFSDRDIAQHASEGAFSAYLEGKTLLPIARKVEKVLAEGSELALLVPNGRMCGRCSYGPVELEACNDLLAHHGERRPGSSAPVNNACPQCGWFAPSIEMWPRWVPTATAAGEAHWAELHATEDEVTAAERRARRRRRAGGRSSEQNADALADFRAAVDERRERRQQMIRLMHRIELACAAAARTRSPPRAGERWTPLFGLPSPL
ncbi:hypothetical protein EMIHUDRAFT_229368 [Emiliania huxleyi CCMP1516]|uniref:RING-type domain-containing protein n=2 Tax=Emiliania huxleyi TaxID=2903 RepID=A0A0D3KD14_EMIH1|nr:hypothetical protein EMIHUDRAFT_229368 [Emiliania huxleyi CCMP1516]EOD33649.1 hypothetical protein EMIHUDRAFT_229368 [Emiliania huxleyi CCMP1516]|eukprot:XP_005786078.1 hypothetical protein EMIHUDRAFT_229368 [Emiliania huxleyi CCMP1516]